jgi:hypothetical protein
LLEHFVRRGLRFEDDILDAFTGILTRMEKFGKFGEHGIGRHIWGLPSKEFGAALQWITNMPWPTTERIGFPSWSWAGWSHESDSLPPRNGSFHDIYEGFDDKSTDISVLTCYTIDKDNEIKPVDKGSFERMLLKVKEEEQRYWQSSGNFEIALYHHFAPNSPKELATYIQRTGHWVEDPSQQIFLWASCTTLYVDRPPATGPHPATLNFPIRRSKEGHEIGSIRLKPEWRETQPDNMYFFVSTTGLYAPSGPTQQPLELKFKVILIQWYYGGKLPVFKRIHVSHTPICYTDWSLALPESKFIALV